MEGTFHSRNEVSPQRGTLFLAAGTLLTLLLQWAAVALGPAGVFVNLSVPLPAAYAHMRAGAPIGLGVVLAVASALLAIGDPGGSVAYLLQFGLASALLPWLLRRGWLWDRAIAATLLLLLAAAGITLGGYAATRGVAVTALVDGYVQGEVESALAVYRQAELPEQQLEDLRKVVGQLADFMVRAWPALVTVASGAVLLLTVLLLTALAAGRYQVHGVPFRLWKAPEPLVWLLILAGFSLLYVDGPLQLVSINLLTILLPIYFLQGLAVVTFYFQKKGLPPFMRGLGYLLVAVLNPLPMIVTGVGVFDLWVDFRKPRTKKNT